MTELLQKRVPLDGLPAQAGPRALQPPGKEQPAKLYPWWKSLFRVETAAQPAFHTWQWLDANNGRAFFNDRSYPINIDEIRFSGSNSTTWALADLLINLQVGIRTDYQGDIVVPWLPVTALQTQIDQLTEASVYSGVFRLPAPYFIGYSHSFKIDFQAFTAAVQGQTFEVALHGRDPVSNSPIVLDKHTVVLPAVAGGTATTIAFNEDRDNSLRDAWLDYITFAWTPITPLVPNPFDYIGVRFYPPSGIQWSADFNAANAALSNFTPLSFLLENVAAEQLTVAPAVVYFPQVIHKPVTPYKLLAGQSMYIQGMYPIAHGGADYGFGCIVRGTQEVPK